MPLQLHCSPAELLWPLALFFSGCVSHHSCACQGHPELPFPCLLWPFSTLLCSLSLPSPCFPPFIEFSFKPLKLQVSKRLPEEGMAPHSCNPIT